MEKIFQLLNNLSRIFWVGSLIILVTVSLTMWIVKAEKININLDEDEVGYDEVEGVMDEASDNENEANEGAEGLVSGVIDGDTIKVVMGEKIWNVRMIGIDAPESKWPSSVIECLSLEAGLRLSELILNRTVNLEQDISEVDRFDRLLRYVWIEGILINEKMVREGFAEAKSYPPDVKYEKKLREAELLAQAEKLGVWSEKCQNPALDNADPPTLPTEIDVLGYACDGPDLDCGDFESQVEAQMFFESCGFSAEIDPHRLDGVDVGDGFACENLP